MGLILVVFLSERGVAAQSAHSFYSSGRKLFRQMKFGKALTQFRRALELDPSHALAHLELARTLIALRQQGKVCRYQAQRASIMDHVYKAYQSRPSLKERIMKETSFNAIRDTVGYQWLMGYTSPSTQNVSHILRNVSWFAVDDRLTLGLSFKTRGRCHYFVKHRHGNKKYRKHDCTWTCNRRRVVLTFARPINGLTQMLGEFQDSGVLWFEGLPGPFTDEPQDCR